MHHMKMMIKEEKEFGASEINMLLLAYNCSATSGLLSTHVYNSFNVFKLVPRDLSKEDMKDKQSKNHLKKYKSHKSQNYETSNHELE